MFVAVVVLFFAGCGLALYKLQNTSTFLYGVTQVIPFPVAKAGKSWVSYESYLFELRRNMHYYQTQQGANFSTKSGKSQLNRLKQQAMTQVIQDAYVKQLAQQYHVTVSDQAVNSEITLVKNQNRLGSNNRVFDDVLSQFWGWSEDDFKQELHQQMLGQAVVAKLDTATDQRAQAVLKQLQGGADFATLATQDSDDASTKASGGQYPGVITAQDQSLAPQVVAELFKLKAGQVSPIINTGYALEILKVDSITGSSITASHIEFNFQPVSVYVAPLQKAHPAHAYIKI